MNWFISQELAEAYFLEFFKKRLKETGVSDLPNIIDRYNDINVNAQFEICRLVMTNQPRSGTCYAVCEFRRIGDCEERASSYCKITTNKEGKYDRVDWRKQAIRFLKSSNKFKDRIEKILGKNRLNYFLAPLMENGRNNLDKIKRSDRDEWIKNYGQFPEIDLDPVTIQEMAEDPWEVFIKTTKPKEEHLLTCLP